MSKKLEKFKTHDVHRLLKEAISSINTVPDNNSELQSIKQYLASVILALQDVLRKVNKESSVDNGMLDDISSIILDGHAFTSLMKYVSDKKPNHLIIANKSVSTNLRYFIEEKKVSASSEEMSIISENLFKIVNDIEFLREETKSELKEVLKDIKDKCSKIIKEAKDEHEKIKNLHGIVAGESFTGSYEKTAKLEKSSANTWRGISVACISLTIITALYATSIPIAENGNLLIGQIIKAFSIGGTFLYGSFYAAKQSTQHRTNANRAHWLATGIDAVGAFTELLSEEDKNTARFKAIEIILGQQENENHAQSDTSNIDEIKKQLASITGMLSLKQ